ncbi:hypothetical protein [Anaeromyxobacter paludicola]|uniref:Uncharacterized protein n=1 Tax=Anaeromyxobacter paludicola TaxID=2918171 RepID=A0ABM7XCF8_9BACT|nr:hypothetical protein [Anaeromyxobacter paludicola]BDG09563.1 hypothetical protein AMPC_26760 [Anaeromyxobacter paludicola]
MRAREVAGRVAGLGLAPLVWVGGLLRRDRFFHPRGALYRARAERLAEGGGAGRLAERLAGPVVARLSNAWWRGGRELPDVLGCALRFVEEDGSPSARDQDLLLATIRHPWTTLLAPLTTDQHDFLGNDYYAVSPFRMDAVGEGWLRLLGPGGSPDGPDRWSRLARAVEAGAARFELQLKLQGRWEPVIRIRLESPLEGEARAARFHPFRAGRGLRPVGFVHALRPAAYGASRRAVPLASR